MLKIWNGKKGTTPNSKMLDLTVSIVTLNIFAIQGKDKNLSA